MLAIELPEDIESRLESLAKAAGKSKAEFAREAILDHLEELEDLHIAQQRLADIRSGKTQTVSLEKVLQDYGLAD